MASVKQLIVGALAGRLGAAFLRPLMSGRATIFMLHRFRCADGGIHGHDPAFVRAALEYLRANRYELVSLRELYARMARDAMPVRRAVAFTIDDGYFDHAEVAAPIFAAFDCPVTTFVTTGFLDGQLWFWWDQIEYVFESTARSAVSLTLGSANPVFLLDEPRRRAQAKAHFTDLCKAMSTEERQAAIVRLADSAYVDLPTSPPRRYAPMTWDALRAAEKGGMEFGPHTVTHPILAKSSAEQSEAEVSQSWTRLQQEAANPLPVFCYPNGRFSDFGEREIQTVRRLGMSGAVSGEPGYFDRDQVLRDADEAFRVRRFAFSDDMADVVQYASGIERMKQALQAEA
jgi:peptidoglycan/xylan/chitin deacetylase (PgdA/CDA1 family)